MLELLASTKDYSKNNLKSSKGYIFMPLAQDNALANKQLNRQTAGSIGSLLRPGSFFLV